MKLSLRHTRLIRLQSYRWRRRALFIAGGVAVGLTATALAYIADFTQLESRKFLNAWPYAALVVTPLGFGLSVFLTRRLFPNSQGSGIPQAIAARTLKTWEERHKLVSLRIAFGKILLTTLGLLVGASTGREGPTVQVGASIMFALGRVSVRRQPGLILAGAAAGVAAAFNTPLAGIVFGIEEMSRSFETRTSGLIIGTIVAAGLVAMALLGNYTYFGTSDAMLASATDWIAVPLIGAIGGLAGGLFSRLIVFVSTGVPGRIGGWIKRFPVAFAMTCGLAVAICGLLSGGSVYGTGYNEAKAALHGASTLPPGFGLLKLVATALSSMSGIPGGLFSPSLAVGAGLGAEIASYLPGMPTGALVLLGMVSYFTGVVQAPITAFVIVSEMTGDHGMLVPLMLAALIAQTTSRMVCREGVYHALAKNFTRSTV